MGIIHIIKNIDASNNNVGYTPLIPQDLEYLNFFGGDAPLGRNLAPGKPDGTVVGTPDVGTMAEGATFTQVENFIQTQVAHVQQMTYMVVGKVSGPGEYFGISNYNGSPLCSTLRMRSSGAGAGSLALNGISAYTDAGVTTGYSASTTSVPDSGVYAIAMRFNHVPGTRGIKVNLLTSGLVASPSAVIPESATQNVGANLRIGSGHQNFSASAKPFPILFAGIWSRYITDDELQEQYEQLKDYYQSVHGLSV